MLKLGFFAMTRTVSTRLNASQHQIADFCRRNRIRELALFGSALREDFTEESDFDLLVSFQPGARVGFLALARMQRELEGILGREVDLVPKKGLKPAIRDHVLASAERLYAT